MIMDTLSDLKKDMGEVKSVILNMQNRKEDCWSRVDTLMSFLQYLWQAITDYEKGKTKVHQVYARSQLELGF
jgi:hypothetical protein